MRPPHAEDSGLRPFDPPAKSAMEPCTVTREADWHRTITRDVATGATELVMVKDSGGIRYDDIDWRLDCAGTERYRIRPDDPLSAEADCVYHHELSRGDFPPRMTGRRQRGHPRGAAPVDGDRHAAGVNGAIALKEVRLAMC